MTDEFSIFAEDCESNDFNTLLDASASLRSKNIWKIAIFSFNDILQRTEPPMNNNFLTENSL